MHERVAQALKHVAPGDRLLLAVSGGGDSLAMLCWFADNEDFRHRIAVAHVDHGLRTNSAEVARIVENAADTLGVPFCCRSVDVATAQAITRESLEACARRLRYAALEEMRSEMGCDHILTAHTRDDCAETVAMKLNNDSSWYECTGIPVQRGSILRPFLGVKRAELRGVLDVETVVDEDPMNRDSRFPRVRCRMALQGRTSLVADLVGHSGQLRQLFDFTEDIVTAYVNKMQWHLSGGQSFLEILPKNLYLEDLEFLICEISWRRLSGNRETRWPAWLRRQVQQFLQGKPGDSELCLPDDVVLRKSGSRMWMANRLGAPQVFPHTAQAQVVTPSSFGDVAEGQLALRRDLSAQLEIRAWRSGERFKPLNRRTRKLSDWLSEGGVHPAVRPTWPVICRNDEIVAVPGLGICEAVSPGGQDEVKHIEWRARNIAV